MKKKTRLPALALCAALLLPLTGCGNVTELAQNVTEKLLISEEGTAFSVDTPYTDEDIQLTVSSVTIAYSVSAPLTLSDDGSVRSYYAEESGSAPDDQLYLDCTVDIENNSADALDLKNDLLFYAVANDTLYGECLILQESADGTELTEAGTLDAGDAARIHYAVLLPTDIQPDALDVGFVTPVSNDIYRAHFDDLAVTERALGAGGAVKTNSGAMLTITSASIGDAIDAVSDAGGDVSIQLTEGGQMMDVVLTVQNDSEQDLPLGTLFGGRMTMDGISALGSPLLEADGDILYAGTIPAGETRTAHLAFDATDFPRELTADDSFYLYVDGMYYPILLDSAE